MVRVYYKARCSFMYTLITTTIELNIAKNKKKTPTIYQTTDAKDDKLS